MTAHPELRERARELAREPYGPGRRAGLHLLGRLQENERTLRRVCERLLLEAQSGRPLSAKAAWLLDNYSHIQAHIREVREALPRGYYCDLPRITGGPFQGSPRVYRFLSEVLAHTGGEARFDALSAFFHAVQERAPLQLAELWAIPPLLKLLLIERLCEAAERDDEDESGVKQAITGLRALEIAPWRDFIESISSVDQVLRQDPAGVYARMEFQSRDGYRHAVEGIAKATARSEAEIARLAVELAREAAASNGADPRKFHVGYYLCGAGFGELKRRAGYSAPAVVAARDLLYRRANAFYLGGILLVTLLVLFLASWWLAPVPWWLPALLLIPASQAAVAVMNRLVNLLVPPRGLPKLDFSEGVPDDARTFVVVPTLLLSRRIVERLLERLEIHYLANRDPNLFFALLTDFPDSPSPAGEQDHLLELCAEGIRLLNERYGSAEGAPFYLFHRERKWNPSEGAWMGHERKRGKLVDFNRLLLGEADAFSLKVGDLSVLPSIRYVITLDSDTQLPRDTARKLIGTLAHPLNRPVIDPATNTVREGYAILQPRISISMESAGQSRLARIYSGETGYDPYTTAVSDVYQDLHGQASFTGKGIYDVRAFQAVVGSRFPENTLLSHDLIEGEYARTALVSDLELIDDYPASYESYSRRKHRWVRGDWQLIRWLFSKVPGRSGMEPNPLGALSRWKIADNLRRSLFELSLLALLIAGWLWLPGAALRCTSFALGLLLAPCYVELGLAALRLPRTRLWRSCLREALFRLARGHVDAVLCLTFLVHQACLMTDAVVRTLIRVFFTRRKLLEWETMAQSEESAGRRAGIAERYLLAPPVFALLTAFSLAHDAAGALGVLLLELWILSPLVAMWLNGSPQTPRQASAEETGFLRDVALRTWRYFRDLFDSEHNWLIPDNVQEDPPAVAGRASPTNLGLLLTANLAAYDFGYLTPRETAERLGRTLETMSRLERFRGHFYNWYDTRTLQPLPPRYVSTVDSGNLAASLVTVKQGCLELLRRPVVELSLLAGLRDHCLRLRNALPQAARTGPIMRLLASLDRQLDYTPTDLFFWEGVLSEAAAVARRLRPHLEWVCTRLEAGAAAEVNYWYEQLDARLETALADLCALAPWLAPPYELELRSRACDPSLTDLLRELERVTALSDLPAQYEQIAMRLGARLRSQEPLHPSLRSALEGLLQELPAARSRAFRLARRLERLAAAASSLVEEMDFRFLFDRKRKLLRIGYDAAAARPDTAYYDLLASEARTAVFIAIAKGEVPREAWFHLGRKLVSFQGDRTLLSWGGTMFEYVMPCLFMRACDHTLLAEGLKGVLRIQQRYAREKGVPWGISEAASNSRDSALNYEYQAFGVPEIALNRKFTDDLVIAPYASVLALMIDRPAAAANLRDMAARGWTGRYGFFESVDHTARRCPRHQRAVIVRAFMAHHQGMSLAALANTLLGAPIQRRFHADPLVQATEFLLHERVPLLFGTAQEEETLPARLLRTYEQLKSAGAGPLQAQPDTAVS